MVGIHPPYHASQYALLGIPRSSRYTPVLHIPLLTVSWCTVMKPWAQDGNIPWVGEPEREKEPKGVRKSVS